jgi:YVTN family beta-propeller protein
VVDLLQRKQVALVPAGQGPHGITITPDGKKVYVSNRGGDTLTVIDTATRKVINNIPVGKGPGHIMSIMKDGRPIVYVNSMGKHAVLVVDAESDELLDTIPIGSDPHQMAYRPAR